MKSLHVGAMVVLTAAAARTFAALPTNGLVAAGSHAEVTVTGQTNVAGLAVSGTLEKRGAGELVLTNLYSLPGTVWAREGTVTLAEAGLPVSLPAALQRGLAFWVDAATNVVTDGSGRVDKWLDVRESSTIEPYAYMRAEHDYTYYPNGPRARNPILASGNASVNSLPMVDFGTFGATNSTAAWLPWRKKDGTRGVVTNIHAVFAVATFTNSNGHFLSDWDYCAEGPEMTNRFGSADFNQGSSVDTLCYRLFSTSVAAYRSSLYVNGVQADGDRPPDMLGQILEVVSPASLTAANFFNYRNSDRSASLPNIGGGQLGEVLVYTNALTEAERLSIEGYLFRKWKRETRVGSVRIQSGASAVSVVDGSGTTNRLWSVSGDGDWHKIGAGTAGLINDSSLMYGSVQLGEGTLVDDGYVRRPNRLFAVPDSGLMVRSDTNRWECVSTVATNAVVKTGAGALTVTDFPTNVTHVAVSGGTLRLTQALCDPERVEPLAVYNNSFEIFDNHDNHGPWSDPAQVWGFLPTGTGWTVLGYAEDGKSVGGIYKPDGSSVVWCAKQPAPEGEWVAFIKQGGGWETTFNVSVPGYHRLVFYTTGRYLNGKHQYNVLIDGQVIAQIMTIQILFERREFVLPWLSDGQHTLTFQGVDDGRDQTSLLDDVRIERIGTAQAAGIVTNGGFEISAPLTDTWGGGADPGYYSFSYAVTNAGWTFAASGSGISEGYSPWLSQRFAPEGRRVAYVRMTGTMSTTVTFPANGTYELSFLNAARPFWLGHTDYYGSHNYRVTMGGEQVLTRYSQKMCFERVTVRLPAITNAPVSKELCFDGINTLGGDRTSLFDDVRVSRLPDGDSAIVDGGFEMPVGFLPNGDMWGSGITGTAWTFDTNAISLNMSGIVRNGSAWNCPFALDGTAAAFLQMKARMSQPVTFTEDGYYTLSFMAVGRLQNWVGNWACLHDFRILFNGEQVGSVQTFDATWRRYTFRLPYVKAGVAHSLVFEGLNSMAYQLGTGTDHTSFLDDVRVEKQTAVGEAATPGSYRKLAVHLTEGSKLALDFSGQTVFKEIRYNGSPYSGTLDASNTPFLTGAGSVYVSPKGTVVLLH